jgi:hypothetical protein
MVDLYPLSRFSIESRMYSGMTVANHDGECVKDPMIAPLMTECPIAADNEDMALSNPGIVLLVRRRLEQHPHFRGRSSMFIIELIGETIVLMGRVPSYYLKQLLQEAVMAMPGVVNVDNQVRVFWTDT